MAYGLEIMRGFHETRDRLKNERRQEQQQDRQNERQDTLMSMRKDQHHAQMDENEVQRQLQEHQIETQMLGELARWAAAGNPQMGVERANQIGGDRHSINLREFDQETGRMVLVDENGTEAETTLEQLQYGLQGPGEQPEPVKVGEGDALVDPRTGETIYTNESGDGSGNGRDPAMIQTIDGLVERGVARDESHAYELVQAAKFSPQEMIMDYAQDQMQRQQDQGVMEGDENYRSREQLVQEGRDLVREIQSHVGPAEQGGQRQGGNQASTPPPQGSPSRRMGDQAVEQAMGPRRSRVPGGQQGNQTPGLDAVDQGADRQPARGQSGGETQGGNTLQIGERAYTVRRPDQTDRQVARELPAPEENGLIRDNETGRVYGSDGRNWYPLEVN